VSELATPADWEPGRSTLATARGTAPFGVIVFLASDVMLFAPFFAAYFLLRSTNEPWPPPDVELNVLRAALGTAALVASSFTLIASERAGERAAGGVLMRRWLLVTIFLGAIFLINQLTEYATLGFGIDSHPYGSAYWGLTGLHALHVTAGLCALALLYVRTVRSRGPATIASWSNGVSLFWHLVDVIWIFVFSTIWILQ
jgi:cytochrome c oxidase subunit III